jgi:hypothetical protein
MKTPTSRMIELRCNVCGTATGHAAVCWNPKCRAKAAADELAYLESIISTGQTSTQLPTNHNP